MGALHIYNTVRLHSTIGDNTLEDKLAGQEKETWGQREAKPAAERERRRVKRQEEKKAG